VNVDIPEKLALMDHLDHKENLVALEEMVFLVI
jgi:hypothetical protein